MTIFLESPIPILCIGLLAEAVLGLIMLRTGRGVIFWPMGGVLLLVLGGVLLEWLVVTEKERVAEAIDGAAAALEANDEKAMTLYLAKEAANLRAEVHWAMTRVEFTKAKITRLEIDINELSSPPTAKVHVQGYLMFNDRKGEYPYHTQPVKELTLDLRRDSDRWVITGYTYSDDPRK